MLPRCLPSIELNRTQDLVEGLIQWIFNLSLIMEVCCQNLSDTGCKMIEIPSA